MFSSRSFVICLVPIVGLNLHLIHTILLVKVAATVVPAMSARQGWRLVRVDVRNMSTTVNHHFDYEKDGHQRKYQLHCETTGGVPHVYIVRAVDGFAIPYDTIDSMSLIAILRMGLLEPIKRTFYDQFLKLPMYEDMAPWNIVFRYGQLDYIDYDTKVVREEKSKRGGRREEEKR